jgi:type IV pilus assembly protein PilC
MILQMVRTGEETGELDAMLNRAADFYEDEVDAMVAAISSLVEPLLVVILGAMIGVVVVAMYLPIFHLASVF